MSCLEGKQGDHRGRSYVAEVFSPLFIPEFCMKIDKNFFIN